MATRTIVLSLILLSLCAGVVRAQNKCTTETIKGQYGVTCSGFAYFDLSTNPPTPSLTPLPFTIIGTGMGDSAGFIVGTTKVKTGMTPAVPQTAYGKAVVNEDCTGNIDYYATPTLIPESLLYQIDFQILDQGKRMRGMVTSFGVNAQCDLVLMSHNTNQ